MSWAYLGIKQSEWDVAVGSETWHENHLTEAVDISSTAANAKDVSDLVLHHLVSC